MSIVDYNYRNRNILQWTRTPCGTSQITAKEGTKEFFEQVRNYRYTLYAPWLIEFIRSLNVKDKKLLEIGCGVGTDLLEFAKMGAICYGVDLTPKHIELAKKLFKYNNIDAKLYVMDATKLEFEDEYFDIIYSHGVLHHIPQIKNALKEIHRVLKKDGKAYLMVYHKRSFGFYFKVILYHGILRGELFKKSVDDILSQVIEENAKETKPYVKVYSISEFKENLHDAGLKIEKIYLKHLMNEKRMKTLRKFFPKKFLTLLENYFGWYIVAEVSK